MWHRVIGSADPLSNALWSLNTTLTTKPGTLSHPNICQIPPNNNTNMLTLKFTFNFLLFSVLLTDNPMEKHFYTLYNSVGKESKQRPLTSLVTGLPTWFPTALSTFRFRSGPLTGASSFLTARFSPLSCLLLIFLFISSPAKKSDHASLSHVTNNTVRVKVLRSVRMHLWTVLCSVSSTSCKTKPWTCSFLPKFLNIMK